MGPLTPDMHARMQKNLREGDLPVDVPWRSLSEYLVTRREDRRLAERRFIHRRHNPPHLRGRSGRPSRYQRGARRYARPRPRRDVGRSPRHRFVADLSSGVLRLHRGADRALPRRRAIRRQVHLPYARRRPCPDPGRRGAPAHQSRRWRAGGDLSPEASRQGQLAQARPCHRDGRERPRRRRGDLRRHVHLHRWRNRALELDPTPLPRRRSREAIRTSRRSRRSRGDPRRDRTLARRLGEPLPGRRGRRRRARYWAPARKRTAAARGRRSRR